MNRWFLGAVQILGRACKGIARLTCRRRHRPSLYNIFTRPKSQDIMAEWLRRHIRNVFHSWAQVRILLMSLFFAFFFCHIYSNFYY